MTIHEHSNSLFHQSIEIDKNCIFKIDPRSITAGKEKHAKSRKQLYKDPTLSFRSFAEVPMVPQSKHKIINR